MPENLNKVELRDELGESVGQDDCLEEPEDWCDTFNLIEEQAGGPKDLKYQEKPKGKTVTQEHRGVNDVTGIALLKELFDLED